MNWLALFGFLVVSAFACRWQIQRMRLKDRKILRQRRSLEALGQIGPSLLRLTKGNNPKAALEEVASLIQNAMNCPACLVKIWYFVDKNLCATGTKEEDAQSSDAAIQWQWHDPVKFSETKEAVRAGQQYLCLPIRDGQESFGVLQVGCQGKCTFDDQDLLFHGTLAQELLVAFRHLNLVKELREKVDELKMTMEVGLSGLTTFTGSIRGMEETVSAVLKQVVHLLRVDRATLLLWDEQQQLLWPRTVAGMQHKPPRLFMQLGEGLAGWALKTGRPYAALNAPKDPHYVPGREPIRSMVCMPMVSKDGGKLGVLCASTMEQEKHFNDRDLAYLSLFAAHVALAVENAQLHQREREQTKELDLLNQLKNDMISIVSHDLQVPLTGILGYTSMMLEDSELSEPDRRKYLQNIVWSAEEENRIIQNLVDMTKISRSQIKLTRQPCDVKILILEQVEKFRMICSHRPLNILFEASPEDMVLDLDQTRILQVVNNLLANAAKFSSDGGAVQVKVSFEDGSVHVSVNDSGVGIPPEELGRVFVKYYQICGSQKPGRSLQGGLGLGLAICKMFVEAHGGKIWAESPGLGHGSTFHFLLPRTSVPSSLSLLQDAA